MTETPSSVSSVQPKVDGRKNRPGRFEIVITDLLEEEKGPRGRLISTRKVGTSWHVRWRADGNLRMISSSELLTSKRNAEKAIASEAGVARVVQDNDRMYAVLVDGSTREVRIVDQRNSSLAG